MKALPRLTIATLILGKGAGLLVLVRPGQQLVGNCHWVPKALGLKGLTQLFGSRFVSLGAQAHPIIFPYTFFPRIPHVRVDE